MTLASDIVLANRLADAAGTVIRPFFRATLAHQIKADLSPVTEADRAAEEAMRRLLEVEAPGDGIIGEEYGSERLDASRHWVIDPLDGTVSFMSGRPIFGTLIALLQEGSPILGVIDQPISGERWVGAVGQPTLFNNRPAKTRRCGNLADAVLAATGPHHFSDEDGKCFTALTSQTSRERTLFGGDCYNYGLLAIGHVDLVVEAGLKLHDFAALIPIVEGAGGTMCDWHGKPLHCESEGHVIALGDPAHIAQVIDLLDYCD